MMNSEIATSVAGNRPLIIVVADNHGYGCIHRLQRATAGATHNNLLRESFPSEARVDFVAHARALGADATKVADVAQLEAAVAKARRRRAHDRARHRDRSGERHRRGGAWWNVPVAEVSGDAHVRAAREAWQRSADDDGGKP
jgi:3D-(3,5/4)-trihydroxycyclohexane-1,2-dione acylhydrolase (decyclizing)